MTLDLTPDEAQTLLTLLDAAVRAQGLNAAQAALPLAVKVQQVINAAQAQSAASENPSF